MTATIPYVYPVSEVVRVVDGDTYWLRLDVGFRETLLVNVRLSGFDCPELRSGSAYERAQGAVARDFAASFFRDLAGDHLYIRTEKDPDDFGRWLGDVWIDPPDGTAVHLGARLYELNLATRWPTRWREVYDTGAP